MAKYEEKSLPSNAFDQVVLAWIAPEYLRYERGWLWFTFLFIISGLLIAYAYFTHSITMMVVFAILPLVLILEHRKKPKLVDVVLSPYGIKFGVLQVPYNAVRAFWVTHNPPAINELHLHTTRKLHPDILIPLGGTDPSLVRQYLVTQIPEWEGRELSLLDILIRVLRLN